LAEIHDDDGLFSPGYWLYSMPKQYGSSVSSDAAIAGQAISLGGMAAGGVLAALGHPEAGLGVYNVAQMASTPYSMKGGFEENEGETADKWIENYRNNLSKNALFGSDMSNVYKDL
jgi:hypothetical protein